MTPELISKIVEAVVTILIAIISCYFIPWLKNRLGEDKYNLLVSFAETVVRSAEKIYTQEEWEKKKEYALELVLEKSDELGLKLNYEEVNAIIEGAVQAVKG